MTATPFEKVVDEHGDVVLRICRAVLGPTDAEDAWSETFLAALEAYPRLRPDSNVRGWLVTIAHRKAIDQLRAGRRRPVPSGEVPRRSGDEVSCTEEVIDRDPELWGALQSLPFKQRSAVAYHFIAGLPYAEVGRMVDSNESAARRAAADGLAKLRRTYRKDAAW